MLLAINIGNSSIRIGLFKEESCLKQWVLHTHPHKSADEFASLIRSLFQIENWDITQVHNVAIASVVPALNQTFIWLCESLFKLKPLFIDYTLNTGITYYREKPEELGADLLVNGANAFLKYKKGCIVIDFGTALTLTVVNDEGKLTGVVICPGINTSLHALIGKTAKLPAIELVPPPSVIGANTIECIQSGMVYGFLGMVESLIDRINTENSSDYYVVATGGNSEIFAKMSNKIHQHNTQHTIEGIELIYRLNKEI